MSTTETITANLNTTSVAVTNLMTADNYPIANQSGILDIIGVVLQSTSYISSIQSQVQQIIADGKITIGDTTNILVIISTSQTYLRSVITNGTQLHTTLQLSSMKYIIYAVLYFVMLTLNAQQSEIDMLATTFGPLWSLLATYPKTLIINTETFLRKVFPCCFKCKCCPAAPSV